MRHDMARKSLRAWVSALALLGTTMTAGPAWSASADAACVNVSTDSDWVATQCAASPTELLVSRTYSLKALETKAEIAKDCPDVAGVSFRLKHQILSPGRVAPFGLKVTEAGGVGVTGFIHYATDNYAVGVMSLSMSNWTVADQDVDLELHCTSDSSQWYHH